MYEDHLIWSCSPFRNNIYLIFCLELIISDFTEAFYCYCLCISQCLKEGYIKAVGEGLRFGLHRLEFRIHSPISVGTYALDTEILVDGRELVGWRAEETMLDENHISTVVMQQVLDVACL